jgi:hypothetical protein
MGTNIACAAVAASAIVAAQPAQAGLVYDELRTFEEVRVVTLLQGFPLGTFDFQTVEFTTPSPDRTELSGPTLTLRLNDDPNLPYAEGSGFPAHAETTPDLADWGNAFFIRALNDSHPAGLARAQFIVDFNLGFHVDDAGAYALTVAGADGPLNGLPPIGKREQYDLALYEDGVLVQGAGGVDDFLLECVLNLEPGKSYRLKFSAYHEVLVMGLGGEGEALESGVQGATSVLLTAIGPEACPGDASGDGLVDLDDLLLVLGDFGDPGPDADGDADGDGDVDLDDLLVVLGGFDTACPGGRATGSTPARRFVGGRDALPDGVGYSTGAGPSEAQAGAEVKASNTWSGATDAAP